MVQVFAALDHLEKKSRQPPARVREGGGGEVLHSSPPAGDS